MKKENNAGAIASNAGDDFHLLWACKKLIEILKFNSKLQAVVVEGPSADDATQIAEADKLYSIDLSEYYGGKNFYDAESVVFSQLKYSSYQSDLTWTASRLCTASKVNNSIIRRLADDFKKIRDCYEGVSEKLTMKLVSNRKLQDDFKNHFSQCKKILLDKKYKNTRSLLRALPTETYSDIQMIYQTSKLKSTEFIEFLQVLTFDDCDSSVRSILEAEILNQLGNFNPANTRDKFNSLIMNLRKMMLPEAPRCYVMDKNYVLSAMDTNVHELFPAPSIIETLQEKYIVRKNDNGIADYIRESKGNIVCIEATAGIGKTTYVHNIKDALPDDSIAVFYDCYGGGDFLDHSSRRHKTSVAVTQICNLLSMECPSNLLIGQFTDEYEFWRIFKHRLEDTVKYVKQINSLAKVVIVIDAADNSMTAANSFKEECFLTGLLNESLPDDVVLIITTRPERKHLIPFKNKFQSFNLQSFELEESSQHIRSVFGQATENQCKEIHCLTKGNPRLQKYFLSSADNIDSVVSFLQPNGKTMEALFDEFITNVKNHYRGVFNVENLFAILISLPRPIPVNVICDICSISEDILHSICVDCGNGFYTDNSYVHFKDEDFEAYLRNNYERNQNAIQLIAEYMYANRNTNAYCIKYLHFFISQTNDFEKMIDISLTEKINDQILGITEANKIMKQRIYTALNRKEIVKSENILVACKLIYKLINSNVSEDGLEKLIYSAPSEAIVYGDYISVYNIFRTKLSDFDSLSKAALAFSGYSIYHKYSKEYIDTYLAKLQIYYSQNEHERKSNQRPTTENILNIAEAMLRLGDMERAVKLLCGWKPRVVETKHLYGIFKKFLKYKDNQLFEMLLSQKWNAPNKLAIICAFISLNQEPPESVLSNLMKIFSRIENIPIDRFDYNHLIMFTEYLLQIGDIVSAKKILNKFSVQFEFFQVPTFFRKSDYNKLFIAMRYHVLKRIFEGENKEFSEFWKDGKDDDIRRSKEKLYKFNEIVDYLFPLFNLRLRCLMQEEGLYKSCEENLSKIEWLPRNYHQVDKKYISEAGMLILVQSIGLSKKIQKQEITRLISNVLKNKNLSNDFKLSVLEELVCIENAEPAISLILNDIENSFNNNPASAQEISEVYLKCSKTMRMVDRETGKEWFHKAMESSKGLDYDSYRKIFMYKTFADKISNTDREHSQLALKLIRISEDFCRKIGDVKNFPYEQAIGAATVLSPKSIWGTLCRLDDRDNYNGFSLSDNMPIVVNALLESGKMSVHDAVSFMGFLLSDEYSSYDDLLNNILSKLVEYTPSKQKDVLKTLIDDTLHYAPMFDKEVTAEKIVKYLDANVVSPELETNRIRDIKKFLNNLTNQDKYNLDKRHATKMQASVETFIESYDIVSEEELKNRLNKLNDTEKLTFVKVWLDSLNCNNYIDAITWLLKYCSENKYYKNIIGEVLTVISEFVESHTMYYPLNKWRKTSEIQKHYISAFSIFFLYTHNNHECVYKTLLSIFPATFNIQAQAFIECIVHHDKLYDEQLVEAICKISKALSDEDILNLFNWTVDIEMEQVHPKSGDSVKQVQKLQENDIVGSELAYFVWRCFGHKDTAIRCKASHILFRYALLGDIIILENIKEIYNYKIPNHYIDEKNYFFEESAKVWYLMTCLHISKSIPEKMISLYPFFKSIAVESSVVHALQRKLAKELCIAIAPYFGNEDMDCTHLGDNITFTSESRNQAKYERACVEDSTLWRFNFDIMDTLPYWYDNLAEMFECTQSDVATDCDYYS